MKALALSGGKDSMACLHLLKDELDIAIFVDTGFAYPETLNLIEYARSMVEVVVVRSDRVSQNEREGIPSDVVPINWTRLGESLTVKKGFLVQSYLGCCFENLFLPLMAEAKRLGVKTLYLGQRKEENHKSSIPSGSVDDGITRIYPIDDWTEKGVFDFLSERMEIPSHYSIKHSSLDCYDCTAYRTDSSDRVEWTKEKHPSFYSAYSARRMKLDSAISQAIGD